MRKIGLKGQKIYYRTAFLITGIFACFGVIIATQAKEEFSEKTFYAVLSLILLFLAKWLLEDYTKVKEKLEEKNKTGGS